MNSVKKIIVYMVFPMLMALSGCSTDKAVQSGDPDCDYTEASFDHVYPRHCDPGKFTGKSKFDMNTTDYCNGKEGGQNLCETVQGDPDQRIVQPDKLICYDKNMGAVVGTKGEKWVRVVIKPETGVVVTQFPELKAGCH